jgi:hypothetical protein
VQEERVALRDIVSILVDRSESMALSDRTNSSASNTTLMVVSLTVLSMAKARASGTFKFLAVSNASSSFGCETMLAPNNNVGRASAVACFSIMYPGLSGVWLDN